MLRRATRSPAMPGLPRIGGYAEWAVDPTRNDALVRDMAVQRRDAAFKERADTEVRPYDLADPAVPR